MFFIFCFSRIYVVCASKNGETKTTLWRQPSTCFWVSFTFSWHRFFTFKIWTFLTPLLGYDLFFCFVMTMHYCAYWYDWIVLCCWWVSIDLLCCFPMDPLQWFYGVPCCRTVRLRMKLLAFSFIAFVSCANKKLIAWHGCQITRRFKVCCLSSISGWNVNLLNRSIYIEGVVPTLSVGALLMQIKIILVGRMHFQKQCCRSLIKICKRKNYFVCGIGRF